MATTSDRVIGKDEYSGAPRAWFFGEEWHRRDVAAVFRPRWLLAGHLGQLASPEPGRFPYITSRLGAEEVLIRQDEDGVVRGYHNVCPHRGATLCPAESGTTRTKRIVCPYHGWSYALSDGKLLSASHMHEGFDLDGIGLTPVHVDVWNELIFVCFHEARPAPVAEHLGGASLGGYDLTGVKVAHQKRHIIRANWKIVVENKMECYHCRINHPELCEVFDPMSLAAEDFESVVAERAAGGEVYESAFSFANMTVGGERVCAIPTPRIVADAEPDTYYMNWEPGLLLNISLDHAWIFAPRPVSPDVTELLQFWLVAKDAREGVDYDPENLMTFWDRTMSQDQELCEGVQRGMSDPTYTPGPFNRIHQAGNAGFHAWYTEQIRRLFPDEVRTPPPTAPVGGGCGWSRAVG